MLLLGASSWQLLGVWALAVLLPAAVLPGLSSLLLMTPGVLLMGFPRPLLPPVLPWLQMPW